MTRMLCSLIASLFIVDAASAGASHQFEISIRLGDSDVQQIRIEAPDGKMQQLHFEGRLQVELTADDGGDAGYTALVQLMRSTDLQVLHTARLSGLKPGVRRIGYVVCGDQVTFVSPAPGPLPKCES